MGPQQLFLFQLPEQERFGGFVIQVLIHIQDLSEAALVSSTSLCGQSPGPLEM